MHAAGAPDQLSPRDVSLTRRNTYSGIYGTGAFPLHTDLAHWPRPPRYLLLRCIVGSEGVTTPLLDGARIVTTVGEGVLAFALVRPRRRLDGSMPLLSLLERHPEAHLLRWDEVFIQPASSAGIDAMEKVREAIAGSEAIQMELADEADTLLVDNWRMLHARSAIPDGCEGRLIERAYLEALH
jgi:alpha-ketoglutarate-dependent taurine dioxygenase